MKKVLSFILVLSMVLGSMGMAFANPVETTQDAIDAMVELGFVQGDEGGLRLDETIRRSEVAVIATRIAGLEDIALKSNYQGVFTDVTTDMWDNPVMNGAINVAAGQGYVKGYPDGTFAPNADVTNAEIITLMVRLAVSEEEVVELDKGAWPAAYITKAAELGILDGTNVDNFGEAATRETVFVLGYNAHGVRVTEGNYIVKALVLENDRVETIGKDQVVVEVIEEVQRADFAEKSRKEQGDQVKLDLSEFKDVETLLGKVVNISYNKADQVVKVEVDNSYDYLTGAITAGTNGITLNNKKYTVSLDERYNKDDERIFRTYFNDASMKYVNFARDKKGADFAKVTVKNGKVIFIDAFDFEDIAPVQEIKKDGEQVFVYNDARDGGIKRFDLKAADKVTLVDEKVFTQATREDIKVNDVIHEYKVTATKSGYIVRRDTEVTGEYKKASKDKNGTWRILVDDEEYELNLTDNKRPVYAYDSKEYATLDGDIEATLRGFRGEDVAVLLDVTNKVQSITSKIDAPEFVGLIDNILARDIRIVRGDNEKVEYRVTLDSKLERPGTTRYQSLDKFDRADLVYISLDGETIDEMKTIVEVDRKGDLVAKGDVNGTVKNLVTKSYIKLDNKAEYRVLNRTNVFVRTLEDGKYTLKGITLEDLLADYKLGAKDDVKVIVVTEKEFDEIVRDRKTGDKDVAHTLIFTDIVAKAEYDKETVRVLRKYDDYTIKVVDENNNESDRTVPRTSELRDPNAAKEAKWENLPVDEIVTLSVTKDDDKYVQKFERPLKDSGIYEVVEAPNRKDARKLVVTDRMGSKDGKENTRTVWLSGDAVVFGNITEGAKIAYNKVNNYDEVTILEVKARTAKLDRFDGKDDDLVSETEITYINEAGTRFEVNGEIYKVDENTRLIDLNGKTAAIGATDIKAKGLLAKGVNVKVDEKNNVITLVEVEKDPVDPEEPEVPETVTAEAKFVVEFIGIKSYDIIVEGAEATDVTEVLVNGKAVTIEIEDGIIMINATDKTVEKIEVVVDGKTILATIK